MKDIAGQDIKYGDLLIIAHYNRFQYAIFKKETQVSIQFYGLNEWSLNKLKFDNGIRELDTNGWRSRSTGVYRYKGGGFQIGFINVWGSRVLKINEEQLPEKAKEIYNKMKEIIDGNTGS